LIVVSPLMHVRLVGIGLNTEFTETFLNDDLSDQWSIGYRGNRDTEAIYRLSIRIMNDQSAGKNAQIWHKMDR